MSDFVTAMFFIAASVAAAGGVAYLAVCVLRIITGNPNGWLELGIWIWFLSVPLISGSVGLMRPGLLGYRLMSRQSDEERHAEVRAGWMKALVKSGVLLIGFIVWPKPDVASKVGAVVIWVNWLVLMGLLIRRGAALEWRERRPEPPQVPTEVADPIAGRALP